MLLLSFIVFADLQSGSAAGGGGGGSTGGTQSPAGPGGIAQHLTYTSYILKQTPQVWSSVTGIFQVSRFITAFNYTSGLTL